jgi:hypothetical protein
MPNGEYILFQGIDISSLFSRRLTHYFISLSGSIDDEDDQLNRISNINHTG